MYLFGYAFILSFIHLFSHSFRHLFIHPCAFAGREHKPAVAYFFTVLIYSDVSEFVSINLFGPLQSSIIPH